MGNEKSTKTVMWYEVYRELAELLARTYGKKLYMQCLEYVEFKEIHPWMNKFQSYDPNPKSLDPMHVFASINSSRMREELRLRRINLYFEILDRGNPKEKYSKINFDGCPSPVTISLMAARNQKSQDKIWKVFREIIDETYEKKSNYFEKLNSWYGIAIESFTILLFWIDAKNFLPLDKNTVALLHKYDKFKTIRESWKDYIELLTVPNTNIYLNIALIAWDNKKLESLKFKDKKNLEAYLEKDNILEGIRSSKLKLSINTNQGFKIIAIKPLKDYNQQYLKTLKENELYLFDKSYKINSKEIIYDEKNDLKLYKQDNLEINIHAIVGKNGTGKSTLLELFFIIINNLAYYKKLKENNVDGLEVELYFESLSMYKIEIKDKSIKIFEFEKESNKYLNPREIDVNLEEFFYTIAINYSQYALNSLYSGEWLESLFHKNDAYQVPIVIEPFRKEGNVDINKQDMLIKQRLLANLLIPEDEDLTEYSFRQLNEFYKAKSIQLVFNHNKLLNKNKNITKISGVFIYEEEDYKLNYHHFHETYKNILESVYEYFHIKYDEIKFSFTDDYDTYSPAIKIEIYILKKLVTISNRYEYFQKYFNKDEKKFINLEEYLKVLAEDKSHITYKLKQSINFLKENLYQDEDKQIFDIEKLSNEIEKIKKDKFEKEKINISLMELLPPPFFDIEIILDNDIDFNSLSSGEKQKIYSINSILYHINNLNSVERQLVKYKYSYINIILDEIELYFHPELQRNYLNDLLKAIKKVDTNHILGINMCFVTHSPFILSDIPHNKILFLDKKKGVNEKSFASKETIKTFGANIHELLINGFFMENSIGEFALSKIKEIVDFHYKTMHSKVSNIESLKSAYNNLKKEFYFIQEQVGEEYIAGVLKNHLIDIEKRLNENSFKEKRIKALEEELNELKANSND